MDAWYKEFGHRPIEKYYKLLQQDDETLFELEEFTFDTIGRRVTSTMRISVPFKKWVDALAANTIHPVTESNVPFLFHF